MAEGAFCWEWRKGPFVGNDRRGLLLGMTGGVSGMTEGAFCQE